MAIGYGNNVSASDAMIFGNNITNNIAGSTMIGPNETSKVTILSGGLVGIGTNTPTANLQVEGTTLLRNLVTMQNGWNGGFTQFSGTANYPLLQLATPNGQGGRIRFANGQGATYDTAIVRTSPNTLTIDDNN